MRKVKIITIVLVVILISMIGFIGIYVQTQNRMENKVKDYSYAMDLNGARNITLVVDEGTKEIIKDSEGKEVEDASELTDEELAEKGYTKEEVPYNGEDVLNAENYRMSREKIENRLKEFGVQDYEISQNEENGEIFIKVPEDNNTDSVVSNLETVGKFEIIDTETKEVLMNNSDIKTVNALYGSSDETATSRGTSAYIGIEFTKDGAKKLEEISTTYVPAEEDSSEDTNQENETNSEEQANETESDSSEEKKEKTITMKIDDEEIMTTSFDEPIRTGTLQLTVGASTTDTKTLQENLKKSMNIASILKTGNMPVKYTTDENKYVLSDITKLNIKYIEIAIGIVILIAILVLIIKYKLNGLLSGISFIGLVAMYLLVIRYTNVVLSIQGIFGIIIALILNYIFNIKLLSKIKNNNDVNLATKETYKEFYLKLIPICIAIIVFCFINWTPLSSFGMVMFYGIVLIAVYNFIITNTLLKLKENE